MNNNNPEVQVQRARLNDAQTFIRRHLRGLAAEVVAVDNGRPHGILIADLLVIINGMGVSHLPLRLALAMVRDECVRQIANNGPGV